MLAGVLLTGCASGPGGGSDPDALGGAAILTLEDSRGDAEARETLTMLKLPLPGLGASDDALAEWSQVETSATADRSAAPVALDATRKLALVAGEAGVELVRVGDRLEVADRAALDSPIGSVSLSSGGLAAALAEDGRTLHLFRTEAGELIEAGSFPLDLALGAGARATAALLSPDGATLAVLDAGRARMVFMEILSQNGSVGLSVQREMAAGEGLMAAAWTADGQTLVATERLLPRAAMAGVEIVEASGRVSMYTPGASESAARVTRAMLPALPGAIAVSPDGARAAVILTGPGEPQLALVARDREGAAMLDVRPAGGEAAGLAFDQRGRRLLVAMPDEGALAVWSIVGGTLRDTGKLVDTGPGVSAVAVVPE
jgi:hypothetical protein